MRMKMGKYFRALFLCALVLTALFAVSSCEKNHVPAEAVRENEVAATCKNGYYDSVVYCENCEREISRVKKIIPAVVSHNVENGVCTICGERESSQGLALKLNSDNASYTVIGIGSCTETDIVLGVYKGLPITVIADSAFEGCANITSVTISEGVSFLPHNAFRGCTSLTSISIPDSLTRINLSAFLYCTSISSITVSENNPTYKSIDGNLYTKDGTCLIRYAIGKTDTTFVIPNEVTSIGDEAFAWCENLVSVTIPESVEGIGGWAFFNCASLKNIKYRGTKEDWNSIYKDANWDFWYEDYGSYEKINYTITYNYTGE